MKLYKKLKGMSKGTKLGLATSLVYATSLAIPALADQNTANNPGLEKAITLQEVKSNYEYKLAEYTEDNKLNSKEIEDLDRLLGLYLQLKDGIYVDQTKKDTPAENTVEEPVKKEDTLNSLIKEFQTEFLPFYPGLISEILEYNALQPLEERRNDQLQSLINRSYIITDDFILKDLIDQNQYSIKDILVLNDRLTLYKILQPVKTEKKVYDPVLEDVKKLNLSDDKLRFIKSSYEAYLEARDKEFAHNGRYWSAGLEMFFVQNEDHLGVGEGFFKEDIVKNLKEAFYLQTSSHLNSINRFYEGTEGFKGKFPQIPNWVLFFLGLGLPVLRGYGVTKLMKRDYDVLDVAENSASLICGLMIDFIHPWIVPIRLLGVPFVMEPMRKIFNWYDLS